MRSPVGQAVIFFCCLTAVGIAIGIYAASRGDIVLGAVSLLGCVINAWLVIKGVKMLRRGPPPGDQ